MLAPLKVPAFFQTGLLILAGCDRGPLVCIASVGRLPRWLGWPLLAG